MKNFINIVRVAGVDEEIIKEALNSEMKDFEDAVQTETAIYNDIDIIITRDKKIIKIQACKFSAQQNTSTN